MWRGGVEDSGKCKKGGLLLIDDWSGSTFSIAVFQSPRLHCQRNKLLLSDALEISPLRLVILTQGRQKRIRSPT